MELLANIQTCFGQSYLENLVIQFYYKVHCGDYHIGSRQLENETRLQHVLGCHQDCLQYFYTWAAGNISDRDVQSDE